MIGLGGAAAGGVAATWIGNDSWDLRLSRVTIELPRLPKAFDGFTIAHLTDLHRGALVPLSFIEKAVQMTNSAQPDLVALTGDFISRRRKHIGDCAQAVSALVAPYGKLAVLGNHDYWVDADAVTEALTGAGGCRVLKNEHVTVERGGAQLAIAGLDDPVTQNDDIEGTLSGVPADAAVVLLSHSPDIVYQAADRGVDLILAGHTHGGQVVLPWLGPPIVNSRFGRRFASGLKRVNGTTIYVSRGIGVVGVGVPVRINCPPEVALITLRTPQSSPSPA